LLTDPPLVPPGITKVYVSYTSLSVHQYGATEGSGWIVLKSSGEVELLGTVNVGLTLASAVLPSGKYNEVRLNVSLASVTFGGTNHTAFVEKAQITAVIVGGVEVTSGGSTGVLVDITPTVFNVGSISAPEFVIKAEARAFQIPGSDVTREIEREGFRLNLVGKWWWNFDADAFSVDLQITNANLSANGLSLTVKNTGQAPTLLTLVVVSPASGNNASEPSRLPDELADSAVFSVYPNETLIPVHIIEGLPGVAPNEIAQSSISVLLVGEFNLTAGSSVRLSYSGPITLGFGTPVQGQGVSSGGTYVVTVISGEASVLVEVTA
jgi:hypothetical protein